MATQEQFPDSDKDGATKAQIPHSGVRGYEQPPTRQFDNTSLSEAVQQGLIETPTSPAPLLPPTDKEPSRKSMKKPIAAVVLGLTVAAGAFGIGRSMSDGAPATPDAQPTATGSVNPGEVQSTPTPEQLARQELFYHVSPDYFIDQKFYDQFEGVDTSGPYGFTDVTPYVNQEELKATIQDLLDNEVYVYETGDNDGLLATFKQLPSGEFGGSGTAEDLESHHEYAAGLQAKYPNLPLTSKELVSVDQVMPNADPNTVSVTFTYIDNMVGDYVDDETGSYFQTAKTQEKETWDMSLETIEGWSDGGSRVSWVIDDVYYLDATTVSN